MKQIIKNYFKKIFLEKKYFFIFIFFFLILFTLVSSGISISSSLNDSKDIVLKNKVNYQYELGYKARGSNNSNNAEGISPLTYFSDDTITYKNAIGESFEISSIAFS